MTTSTWSLPSSGWYAVRCLFASGSTDPSGGSRIYEERITLWRATSIDEALALADAEAETYAGAVPESPGRYLGLAQAYDLFDPPGHGAEVFSLMRTSPLDPEDYLDAHFATGGEHQR